MIRAALLCCLLLTACVGGPQPKWFVEQGANISECGPAVAAMAERLHLGNTVTRHEVREFHQRGVNAYGWWSLAIIKAYLDDRGIPNKWTSIAQPRNGIYFINHNHFVLMTDGKVANPLTGVNDAHINDYNVTYHRYIELL